MIRRTLSVVGIGLAAGLLVVGCSTSTSSPQQAPSTPTEQSPTSEPSPTFEPSPSQSQSVSPTPTTSASPTGEITNPVLPPIEIDGAAKESVSVGQTLNVITKNVNKVSTDNTAVLRVSQPSDDGSAQFNAGAEVIGAGSAVLTVTVKGGDNYQVQVTAKK